MKMKTPCSSCVGGGQMAEVGGQRGSVVVYLVVVVFFLGEVREERICIFVALFTC